MMFEKQNDCIWAQPFYQVSFVELSQPISSTYIDKLMRT